MYNLCYLLIKAGAILLGVMFFIFFCVIMTGEQFLHYHDGKIRSLLTNNVKVPSTCSKTFTGDIYDTYTCFKKAETVLHPYTMFVNGVPVVQYVTESVPEHHETYKVRHYNLRSFEGMYRLFSNLEDEL